MKNLIPGQGGAGQRAGRHQRRAAPHQAGRQADGSGGAQHVCKSGDAASERRLGKVSGGGAANAAAPSFDTHE